MSVADEPTLRAQLSTFSPLLALTTVMTNNADADEILRIATTAVRSFGPMRTETVYLDGGWWTGSTPGLVEPPAGVAQQLEALGRAGGEVRLPGVRWAWGLPLVSFDGTAGYVVVGSDVVPEDHHRFFVGLLVQQAAAALANAHLHAREREGAAHLTAANLALERSKAAAEQSAASARRSLAVHERLTRVAVAGEGVQGIALAVQELTGRPVTIEDRYGNHLADAGPDATQPHPKDPPARRDRLLRRLRESGAPVQDRGRLVVSAHAGDLVLGVIALAASDGDDADGDQLVLEHAATVLALELSHRRALAESELRLRRDLVEELLAGTDVEGARERARALDYDLDRPHRVVLVTAASTRKDRDGLFRAVRRATRVHGVGTLLVARSGAIALLSDADGDWVGLRADVVNELGTGATCRVGVSAPCTQPDDFPRAHTQAQLALKIQVTTHSPDQVTVFEDLGVYKLLCEVPDLRSVADFVERWLGPLIEYDAARGAEMVETLASYLECGGNYDATAAALSLHRSTLRYRLQRLREISGLDLADPDTRFNLQLATRARATVEALQAPERANRPGRSTDALEIRPGGLTRRPPVRPDPTAHGPLPRLD
jgi:DNA-binding PucR family transcriptional regulator